MSRAFMRLEALTTVGEKDGVRRVPRELMVDPFEIAAFCTGRVWIKGGAHFDVTESAEQIAQLANEVLQLLDAKEPEPPNASLAELRAMVSAVVDG